MIRKGNRYVAVAIATFVVLTAVPVGILLSVIQPGEASTTPGSGITWRDEVINPLGGLYSSTAIEDDDTVHVVHYDSVNGNLRYATRNPVTGDWTNELVDDGATSDVRK